MSPARKKIHGYLTLVAMCFTIIIGLTLGTYIALSYQSYQHSTFLLHLNHARQLAQTGLEEALWSLNSNDWSTNGAWTGTTTKTFTFTGYTLDQGATGNVAVTVANANTSTPTITAISTVTVPDGRTYKKTLTATTQVAPLFANAVAAGSDNPTVSFRVRFRTGGSVDSYSSATGAYNAATNKSFNAVVAARSVTPNATGIDGYVATFGNPVTFIGGSLRGNTTDTVNANRIGYSAFIPQFSIVEPTGAVTGYIDNSNDTNTYPSGAGPELWVSTGDLTLNANETLTVDGPMKILVMGNLNISGNGRIAITSGPSHNGSLMLFVRGNVAIGGNGIQNSSATAASPANPLPSRFALFCPSNGSTTSTFTYTATNDFYGVMYFASYGQRMYINSGGTFYGAILAGYYVDIGTGYTPTFHYDTTLRTAAFSGIDAPFMIVQLTEQ